jgi:chromosomal replication initiator protein
MHDKLPFNRNVTVPLIQKKVAEARHITVDTMLMPDHVPGARENSICKSRQLSMYLSKSYTKLSLSSIGAMHGNRDHATVLSACRTINNLIETKDWIILEDFRKLDKYLRELNEPMQEINIFNTEK